MRRRATIVLGVVVGCSAAADADPVRTPAQDEVVKAAREQPETERDPATAPDVRAEVEPDAPSAVKPATIVAPDVLPGLARFADAHQAGGTLWIGKLAGNGGRDVVIYLPTEFAPEAAVRLVFHFHGTYSERISEPGDGKPKKEWVGWERLAATMEAIAELQAKREDNVALVYPLSAGKRPDPGHTGWFNKDYDRMWMLGAQYGDDFDALYDQAVEVLTELGVSRTRLAPHVIAEGHSAGGLALKNIAADGTERVSEYLFLDASFQSWADGCFAALQERGSKARVTIVLTDKGIADPIEGRDPWCTTWPQWAAAWPTHEHACAVSKREPRKAKPVGAPTDCEAMKIAAEQWSGYEQWCRDLADGFAAVPNVTLVRTKVTHGDQPRRFSGGLDLPPR